MPDNQKKPTDTPVIKQTIHPNLPAVHGRAIEFGMDAFVRPTSRVWVGTGGDMTVRLAGDNEPVTFKNIPSGSEWHWSISQFLEGTAADIVAMF